MEQISPTITVISGTEPIPKGFEDSVKIALMGSSDLNPGVETWQSKFIQGMASITSTEPGKGIIMYRGMKFLILNCQSGPVQNPVPTFDNPEFVGKISADLTYAEAADAIFYNFLKKSVSQTSLVEFALVVQSGKVVTRSSSDYINYGFVRTLCERYNTPLLPGATTSVLGVLQTMWSFIPKFQEIQKFKLPE